MNNLVHCPNNWYCRGGLQTAQRCPLGAYSNEASMYLEDCTSTGINNGAAIFVTVMLLFFSITFCIYLCYDYSANQAYYQKLYEQDYWDCPSQSRRRCYSRERFTPGAHRQEVRMLYAPA